MNLLIWDFDGTLGYRDSVLESGGGAWTAALLETVQREAPERSITAEELRPYIRSGFPWHTPERLHPHLDTADTWWAALTPVFERAYEGVGFNAERARELAQSVRATYLNPARWHVFNDSVQALTALSAAGWTHVVLSNHVHELPDLIAALGLTSHLTRIFNSAVLGVEKPNPEAFRIALNAMGPTESCWMIGDSFRADVRGAEALGLPAILVRRPHPDAERFAATLGEISRFLSHPQGVTSHE